MYGKSDKNGLIMCKRALGICTCQPLCSEIREKLLPFTVLHGYTKLKTQRMTTELLRSVLGVSAREQALDERFSALEARQKEVGSPAC
eukprot:488103-Amphidinium_carterae.2